MDKLATVRLGSARYSVPTRLRGSQVAVQVDGPRVIIADAATGQVYAQHPLTAPGGWKSERHQTCRLVNERWPTYPRAVRKAPETQRTTEVAFSVVLSVVLGLFSAKLLSVRGHLVELSQRAFKDRHRLLCAGQGDYHLDERFR